jgi:HAD superfamily hydrolase (TIGR01509 family)
MPETIIFDIDGTLLDSLESNLALFQALLKATGYRPPTMEEYVVLNHKPLKEVVQTLTGVSNSSEIERIYNKAHDPGIEVKSPHLQKGAAEAVKALSVDYPLAIATSRIREYMFKPPLDSLKPHFKVAVCYEDTEAHKPDPAPLLLAAQKLGIDPRRCVYVGDSDTDMQTARAAGMRFVLFGSEKATPGIDGSFTHFSALPGVIASMD